MGDFISLDVKGADEIRSRLDQIPAVAASRGVETASQYLAMQLNNYYQAAPYNYLSWAQGGPGSFGGFFSEAQRRFVMASVADGSISIPYPRMGSDPYHIEGSGWSAKIISDRLSMYYSMSDDGQTRMQALRGWNKISIWLNENLTEIIQAFSLGVQEAMWALFNDK